MQSMPIEGVLVDSSVWVEAMRRTGDESLRAVVAELLRTGRAVLCDWVRLELWNGAQGDAEKRWLRTLEKDLSIAPTTAEVWEKACGLAQACRKSGITVPASDLLIAAHARYYGLDLLHRDRHFTQIDTIPDGAAQL
jgi:predicted nucleic acid-binding protein